MTRSLVVTTIAALLLLVACDPSLPPAGRADAFQVIRSSGPVAGIQVKVSYQSSSFSFVGVTGAPASALVHTYDDGTGSLTVGLVMNGSDATGQLLTLNWKHDDEETPPSFASIAAYDSSLTSVANRLSLGTLTPVEQASPAPVRSTLAPFIETSVPASPSEQAIRAASLADELLATFADHPLGDVDGNNYVDVMDALLVRTIVNDDIETDAFMRYHADINGDYLVQLADVAAALKKAVDPTVPSSLVVKPARLTYVDMVAERPVLIGNGGSEPLAGLAFLGDNPRGAPFLGSVDEPIEGQSAVYTVASANDAFGWLRVTATGHAADVIVGNIVILVAGQSNASGQGGPTVPPGLQNGSGWPEVRALTNDYRWLPAVEPLDAPLNQASFDDISKDDDALTSPGVQAARLLNRGSSSLGIDSTDRVVYLIPAALGGSSLAPGTNPCTTVPPVRSGWYCGPADLAGTNRETLFGSAAYRGLVSAGLRDMPANAQPSEYDAEGGPVNAVFWYQGETDSRNTTRRGNYVAHTGAVFTAFEDHFETLTGKPAIIYAQLAPHGWDPTYPVSDPDTEAKAEAKNRMQMDIAERQRRMEEGAYGGSPFLSPQSSLGSPRANSYMVVTNDLPRSDRIHLSSAGQVRLAERIALAYQEHVLGMDVDGTGPRLTGVARSGTVITVTFDREISDTVTPGAFGYSGFFTAWDGTPMPSSLEAPDDPGDASYGEINQITISDVRRHPDNPRAVRLTLSSTPSGLVHVRYMRPFEPTLTSTYVEDVVRAQGSGLPLPSFGPLRAN